MNRSESEEVEVEVPALPDAQWKGIYEAGKKNAKETENVRNVRKSDLKLAFLFPNLSISQCCAQFEYDLQKMILDTKYTPLATYPSYPLSLTHSLTRTLSLFLSQNNSD